jgi:hypothetical protein
LRGVDLMSLPIDRALNVAFAWIMPSDPKERYKIETQLLRPLPGRSTRDSEEEFWSTAREDGAAFMQAMSQQSSLMSGKG